MSKEQLPSESDATPMSDVDSGPKRNRGYTKRRRVGDNSPKGEDILQCLRDEIREMFNQLKDEQTPILSKLVSDMAEIKLQNLDIKKTYSEIEKSLEFINKNYEVINEKIMHFEQQRQEVCVQIKKLEDKLDDIQRRARTYCVEIRNLPYAKKENKEDLCLRLKKIHNVLNIDFDTNVVRDIYRKPGKPDKIRPVVVEFNSILCKNKLLGATRKYNASNRNNKLSTHLIGCEGPTPQNIYISEYLTDNTNRLYFLARDYAKSNKYMFCWTSNGRVYLRKAEGTPHILIKNDLDMEKLKKNV